MLVNRITLIRMKKIAYELKQKGAIDQATGIEFKANGKGEAEALNSLIENNFIGRTEEGKFYLKQREKDKEQEESER